MGKNDILRREWESYRESVIHKDAGKNQLKESELCFYAGAIAMHTNIFGASIKVDAKEIFESLNKELTDFAKRAHLI